MHNSTMQVKFHRHVMKLDNLERTQAEVLKTIDELYQLFPDKDSLTYEEVRAYLSKKNPSRDITYLTDVLQSAQQQNIGPEITQNLIEGLIEFQYAAKSAAISAPIISNQKRGSWHDGMVTLLGEYEELVTGLTKPDTLNDCEMSFEEAISFRAQDSGIKWPLSILNKCMGGVEPGLGLVIARPDTGKTSFILNCLAYFAAQIRGTDNQLLYCGNEEGIIGLKARCGVSLLGCTTEWAEQNPKPFGQEVSKRGGDAIRFHGGVKSTRDVETLVKRYEPLVTVADQIGKFRLPGRDVEGPQGLAEIYAWFRDMSQRLNTMVIGVAQADYKSANTQWLTMESINASKTDVPGELDWGVGIGFLFEQGMEMVRFINVFKNKNKYGRKGRDQVTFNPEKCRYKD
jgi:hypothetical protein